MHVPLIDLQAQYNTIRDEIRTAIDLVLDSQKFILDAQVEGLEKEIAALTGTRYAIGCGSGTDAILLSLLALGVGENDEVITTSYSFFSTAGMISWLKARPVFVDIQPNTFTLETDQVRERISARTKAIIAVHLFGQCSRIEEMASLGVPVIEDAAQAIGALRNGRPAGSIGAISCFSFFPTKNLGAYGDGGMVTTNDEQLANRVRQLRHHGQSSKRYLHDLVGTNSRLDELQAAILRVKLNHLKDWNTKRNQNAAVYLRELQGLQLDLPVLETGNTSNYHQFVILTEERDALRSFLAEKGIGTAIYYPLPLHLQPCFANLGYKPGDFPNAERCAFTSLALPIYAELTLPQLEYVVSTIRSYYR